MIITSPHYNRPHCTALCIEHLRRCFDISQHEVIFVVEPGNDEVLKLCETAALPKYDVVKNDRLYGLWTNKIRCLELGFERGDFVVHLEDDLLLSRDALIYYEWCNRTYASHPAIFSCNTFNKIRAFDFFNVTCAKCGSPPYTQVRTRPQFTSIGMAFWKNRFESIRSVFDGSDISINDYVAKHQLLETYPVLSRINHIGFTPGVSYPSELLQTILESGHKPIGLSKANPGMLRSEFTVLQNCHGREWVKLNDDRCRTRESEKHYKDNYYLEFWAESLVYEYLQFKSV